MMGKYLQCVKLNNQGIQLQIDKDHNHVIKTMYRQNTEKRSNITIWVVEP